MEMKGAAYAMRLERDLGDEAGDAEDGAGIETTVGTIGGLEVTTPAKHHQQVLYGRAYVRYVASSPGMLTIGSDIGETWWHVDELARMLPVLQHFSRHWSLNPPPLTTGGQGVR